MPSEYAVIYERDESGSIGASVPDLPGCVAVGESIDEARALIREAIELHLAGLREDNVAVPPATTKAEYVDATQRQDHRPPST